ncbi:uncharacterized protein LOC121390533 [Gigantopelta aegis]|uniref:uncharacterized protein LOC121390533 n=1 Tax=Gigantopelta aegis TaxID=1735272 RepID=UPI001B88945B|nr:uncharacterized protein LOC121390533 [Gigantopelta aegis]
MMYAESDCNLFCMFGQKLLHKLMLAMFLYMAFCCSSVLKPRSDDSDYKDVGHTYLVDLHLPDGSTRSVTCIKCGPGTHVKKHCTEDFQYSTCEECEDGYYSIGWNRAERCANCLYKCTDKNAKLTKCSKNGTIECTCNPGFRLEVDDVTLDLKHCQLNSTSDVDGSRGTDPPTRGTDPPMRCAVVINEENGQCVKCNMCQRGESIKRFGCKVVHGKKCLKGTYITDRIAHTTAFDIPVVMHRLEQKNTLTGISPKLTTHQMSALLLVYTTPLGTYL